MKSLRRIASLTLVLLLCQSTIAAPTPDSQKQPNSPGNIDKPTTKPRTIVTTDGEVDDKSSFIRYLLYSNEFETVGLIYGNSKWQRHGHGTTWMQDTIDLYGQVRENLLLHSADYPSVEALKTVVYAGNMDENFLHHTGILDTPGSDHIISVLLDKDPRPLWIQAWGGTNTIAQALSRLRESYDPEVVKPALAKLRIFAIAVQDDTGTWIREQFPEVTFILSHQFVALNYQHEGHPYSNHPIFDPAWITENAKSNHGPLGASYPQTYFSEGDSPAFFHLIGNGLQGVQDPTFGGWGGRYQLQGNSQTFYYDAPDDGDKFKAQWRWLIDIQNDFEARLDWCVNTFENANHPPVASLANPERITLAAGQKITLDASQSSDPDGDSVSYSWMHYQGPSSFTRNLLITSANTPTCTITAPNDIQPAQTAHIILTLSDDGSPPLKSYKRIILTLQP